MAPRYQGTLSQQQNDQLGLRNGWATISVACHGVGVRGPPRTEGRTIQRQLPYSWMGAPFGNTQLHGVCAPHPGASTQAEVTGDMPNNPTPYRGRGELDDGYPFTLVWEQTKMVLQN